MSGLEIILERLDRIEAALLALSKPRGGKVTPTRNMTMGPIPERLRCFPRWHATEGLTQGQANDQVRWVARWTEWVAEMDQGYDRAHVDQCLSDAYCWEGSMPKEKRKTPRGRAKFLHGWIMRQRDGGNGNGRLTPSAQQDTELERFKAGLR